MNQLLGIYFLLLTIGFGLLFRAAWNQPHTLLPAKGFIIALAFAALWSFGTAVELFLLWFSGESQVILAQTGFVLRMIGFYGASISLYLSASLFANPKPNTNRVMFFTLPLCFFMVFLIFHPIFRWQGRSLFATDFTVQRTILEFERLVFEPQVILTLSLVYVLFLLAISITPLVFSTTSQKSFWRDSALLISSAWSFPLVLMFFSKAGATGWDLGSSSLAVALLGNWLAFRQNFFLDSPVLENQRMQELELSLNTATQKALEEKAQQAELEKEQAFTKIFQLELEKHLDQVTGLPNASAFTRDWKAIQDFRTARVLLVLESQKPILETKNLLPKVFQERVYHLEERLFCIWLEMIKTEDVQVLAQEMNLGHVGLACTLKHPHSRLLEFAKKSLERAKAEGSIVSSEPSYEFWQRGLV